MYTFQIRRSLITKRKTNAKSYNKHRNIHHVTEIVLLLQKWNTYNAHHFIIAKLFSV